MPSFRLERATSADFGDAAPVYEGAQTASVLSGLADGTYWFRVRQEDRETYSAPVMFQVRHHRLDVALGLFAAGAVVFALTAGLILRREE
jgi:hypothetical protein